LISNPDKGVVKTNEEKRNSDWSGPSVSGYLGYNFGRFDTNSDSIPSFSAHGGDAQFVYNFNKWLGGVLDFAAVTHGRLNNTSVDMTVLSFVAGPRVTYRKEPRLRPFLDALFGGAYSTASSQVNVVNPLVSLGWFRRTRHSPC
jgi:hypothetical protein